jgi:hypothetical protein
MEVFKHEVFIRLTPDITLKFEHNFFQIELILFGPPKVIIERLVCLFCSIKMRDICELPSILDGGSSIIINRQHN